MATLYTVEVRTVAFHDPKQAPGYGAWLPAATTGRRGYAVDLAALHEDAQRPNRWPEGAIYQARIREAPEPLDVVRERMERCAIVMHNGFAPAGWVEVQRDDETSDAEYNDEDAANDVCEVAGVPGTARRCARLMPRASLVPLGDDVDTGGWIVVVPATAAFKAGLIDEATMHVALSEGL